MFFFPKTSIHKTHVSLKEETTEEEKEKTTKEQKKRRNKTETTDGQKRGKKE